MSELYMTTPCKRCHINNHYERMNCWYCGNDLQKEDSFKKGIEEKIIRELQLYIKRSLKIDKVYFICPDTDGALRSLFLKLGVKKSRYFWYENEM